MKLKSKVQTDPEANVAIVDFGEKLDEIVRDAARKEVAKMEGSKKSSASSSTSGYRPGMYPMYRPVLGAKEWKLGAFLKMPEDVKRVGKGILTGGTLGAIGNRVIAWVAPGIVKTQSKLVTEAIAFGVGIIPYLAKPNSTTVGIALPGLFFLVGALTEYGLGATNLLGAKPVLAGLSGAQSGGHSPQDAAVAARRKLAEVQVRMQQARAQAPRVIAQPQRLAV